MERGNLIVIAIVVAAIALFALRFLGESREDAELAALSAGSRVGGTDGGAALGDLGSGPGGRAGAAGGAGGIGSRPGTRGATHGGEPGSGGAAGRGGSAGTAFGGGMRGSGGTLGSSGSAGGAAGGGSGATIADTAAGRLAPKAERRADLVESLSARPPTKSDLEAAKPADRGDDVALQVNTTKDITEEEGEAVGEVKDADGEEGVTVGEDTRVEFPNAGNASKEGSISFTIKPDWAGGDATDNALVQIRQEHEWNNRLEIVKNGEFLRFILTDNTGKEADISARITDWQPGEEKTIEFSWGNGRTEATVDSQVVGRNEYPGELQFQPNTPMIFGADHPGSTYGSAKATISNFTVGKTPLFTQ